MYSSSLLDIDQFGLLVYTLCNPCLLFSRSSFACICGLFFGKYCRFRYDSSNECVQFGMCFPFENYYSSHQSLLWLYDTS